MSTPEELDQATVNLIFALRDSLTDVSRLDFWGGRVTTAIETAAAGSESASQAITVACHKLQIDTLAKEPAKAVVTLAPIIDADYTEWAAHVARNIVYIVALANVARESRKPSKPTPAIQPDLQPTF